MKIVWVDALNHNVVELNDPESISTYSKVTSSLLFWADYLGQPLLVLGKAGLHPFSFTALRCEKYYKELEYKNLDGAATVKKGVPTGWYSSNYDRSTSKYWQNVIANTLQSP